jgi:UDP-glucose 4-epimerase
MRTLLTGASGYIGLHLVRELLAEGHALTALVRSAAKLGPFVGAPGLQIVEADLEEEARVARALEGQEVCVHAALLWGEPGTELEVRDTAVTAKLFDAAGRAGVRRCLYLSSAAVHRPFRGEMDEGDALTPTDLYGATKAAGELFLRAACATYGMTGVVLRPGPVVGPPAFAGGPLRTDHRLAALVAAAVEARPLEVVGEGRQWSDVAMVAQVVRLLTRAEDPPSTCLCVDREPLRWEQIAQMVVGCLGSTSEVRVQPGTAAPARFRTARLEALLGGPADARGALAAHVRYLAQVGSG